MRDNTRGINAIPDAVASISRHSCFDLNEGRACPSLLTRLEKVRRGVLASTIFRL